MTLSDAMDALYREFGYYACAQKSVCFSGAHAMQEMAARMARLREDLPKTIAGFRVAGVTDYLTPATWTTSSGLTDGSPEKSSSGM